MYEVHDISRQDEIFPKSGDLDVSNVEVNFQLLPWSGDLDVSHVGVNFQLLPLNMRFSNYLEV
jgi:hypothetical protein